MGICSSQKNKEIKNKTNEIISFQINENKINENKINENKINEIISFQQKENKLIEYGLLINNYFFDPITGKELWYDKRTKKYKDKINEFYNIICMEEKKNKKLKNNDYIKKLFITEYNKIK